MKENEVSIKAKEITAYFFNKLNVDDLYNQEEFLQMANEVDFMINTS